MTESSYSTLYRGKIYGKINRFRKEAVISFITKKGITVFDVGCGAGELGAALKKEKALTVYGCDISEEAIEQAKTVLDEAFVCDLENSNAFSNLLQQKNPDYVVLSEVLEHFLFPEKILSAIKVSTPAHTEVIVTVPNVLFWKNRLSLFLGNFTYTDEGLMDRGHVHFFSWQTLQKIVHDCGFVITEKNHHAPTRIPHFLKNLFPGLFAYQFIIKMKKSSV